MHTKIDLRWERLSPGVSYDIALISGDSYRIIIDGVDYSKERIVKIAILPDAVELTIVTDAPDSIGKRVP